MLNTLGAHVLRRPVSLACCIASLAIATDFAISGNLLTWIGVPYVADGGSILFKIHPASYLIALAALARVWEGGRPIRAVWSMCWSDPCVACFLACIGFCVLYAAIMTGCCTLIVYIDTFLPAGLLAVALHGASRVDRLRLLRLLQAGFGINAAMALIETAAQANWIPLYLNGGEYTAIVAEFRPTALYDHPLTGGLLTMIGLLLPSGLTGSRAKYALFLVLLSGGLLAFGGRAAAGLTVLVVALRWWPGLMLSVLNRRIIPPAAIAALVGVLVATPCLLLAAQATGFGGRLLGHLYWDDSAQVRLQQWHILDLLDGSQIVFGAARSDLMALLIPLKLQWGVGVIENFWLLMFINLGLVGFPVFLTGMAALLIWCGRQARAAAPYLVASVLVVASSSNSLGRKSNLLVLLVASVVAAAGAVDGQASPAQMSRSKRASRDWVAACLPGARPGVA